MLGPGNGMDSHGAAAATGSTGGATGEALRAYAIGVSCVGPSTIIESPLFTRLWPDYWTQAEHADFIDHVARHPFAGDVIPGSGGCRKLRWTRPGMGKRGGVRVIYSVRLVDGCIVLLVLYSKSARDALPAHVLRAIAEEFDHAQDPPAGRPRRRP